MASEPAISVTIRDAMRSQLIGMLEDYSENRYAAGWCSGIEHDAWAAGGLWRVMGGYLGEWPSRPKYDQLTWLSLDKFIALHATKGYPTP